MAEGAEDGTMMWSSQDKASGEMGFGGWGEIPDP